MYTVNTLAAAFTYLIESIEADPATSGATETYYFQIIRQHCLPLTVMASAERTNDEINSWHIYVRIHNNAAFEHLAEESCPFPDLTLRCFKRLISRGCVEFAQRLLATALEED